MARSSQPCYVPAMIPTIKAFSFVTPKPTNDEMLHERTVDRLTHGVLGIAAVIFVTEAFLAWPR
jgi:hypothetical protein